MRDILKVVLILTAGCTGRLLRHNGIAGMQAVQDARAAFAEVPAAKTTPVPRAVTRLYEALDDAEARAGQIERYFRPFLTKVPAKLPPLERASAEDNRMFNALEGKIDSRDGVRRALKPARDVIGAVSWAWKWAPWIAKGILAFVGLLALIWMRRRLRDLVRSVVGLWKVSPADNGTKRECNAGTALEEEYRRQRASAPTEELHGDS